MAKLEGLLEWGSPIATPLFSAAFTESTYGILMQSLRIIDSIDYLLSLPPEGTYGPDRKNVSELAPRRTEGTYGKCLKYCIPATLMGYHRYFGFAAPKGGTLYLSGTGMQYFLFEHIS